MKHSNAIRSVLFAALALLLSGGQALAKSAVVDVSLWDRGPMSMNMGNRMGMMGHSGGYMPMAPMGISLSAHTVKSGEVTFSVINTSRTLVHEMVVSPLKNADAALPYDNATGRVDEGAMGNLGEVADLEPGAKGTVTVDLKPGQYILYCNLPGHYYSGMWTLITVQ